MNKIKFSHEYAKMPYDITETYLLEVLTTNSKELHSSFVEYDTAYGLQNYELPPGKVIVLLLISTIPCASCDTEQLWTTVRRHTPEKEAYYRSLRGQQVEIVIEEA